MSAGSAAPIVLEWAGAGGAGSFQSRRLAAVLRARGLEVIEIAGDRPERTPRWLPAQRATRGAEAADALPPVRRALLAALAADETVLHVRHGSAHSPHVVAVALSLRLVEDWLDLPAPEPLPCPPHASTEKRQGEETAPEFLQLIDAEHGLLHLEQIAPSFPVDPLARRIELRAVQARAIEAQHGVGFRGPDAS